MGSNLSGMEGTNDTKCRCGHKLSEHTRTIRGAATGRVLSVTACGHDLKTARGQLPAKCSCVGQVIK